MGLSQKAVGHQNRQKTYMGESFYGIKEQLCQEIELPEKVLFSQEKITS